MNEKCQDCKGTGEIKLFTDVVPCACMDEIKKQTKIKIKVPFQPQPLPKTNTYTFGGCSGVIMDYHA